MNLFYLAAKLADHFAKKIEKLQKKQEKHRSLFRVYMKDLAQKYKIAEETDSKKLSACRKGLVEETALKIFEPEGIQLEQLVRVYDIAKDELPKKLAKKIVSKIISVLDEDKLYELINGRINSIEYTIHDDLKEAARIKYYMNRK